MSKKDQAQLIKTYKKYTTAKKKRNVVDVFCANMAEIIFRTMRLEGESVTRKMISALFH